MSELLDSLEYGARIVRGYRASGLTRRDFAAECGIPVTTLDYYVRRTNRDAGSREAERLPNRSPLNRTPPNLIAPNRTPPNRTPPNLIAPNRILPVEVAVEEAEWEEPGTNALPRSGAALSAGIVIRLANGRAIEVARGFDGGLLREVVAALEAHPTPERA